MIRKALFAAVVCVGFGLIALDAQTARPVPRPPAQAQGAQPAGESAAPDGYQPIRSGSARRTRQCPRRPPPTTCRRSWRCERGVVPVSPRRSHRRWREERPHPDRQQGRQAVGTARRHAALEHLDGRTEPAPCSPTHFATNRTIYTAYACCRPAPTPRNSARPPTCMSRRGSPRMTCVSKTSKTCWTPRAPADA
jgi:hypothetical protein